MTLHQIHHPSEMPSRTFRGLAKQALDAGWRIFLRKNGHLRWDPPSGEFGPVFTSGSPSDHRAAHKVASALRKRGLEGARP